MADNLNLVSVLGVLLVLTIFHNPIIVYAGEGVPNVALFTFGDSYYDAGNKVFLSQRKDLPQTYWPYGKSRDYPNGKFSDGHIVPDFIGMLLIILRYLFDYYRCAYIYNHKYRNKIIIKHGD